MKVEYMTHSGSDLLVVNAARCSFGKEVDEFSEKDERLINFLAREHHLLPFRHPQITLRCKAPIFLTRQLGKTQVGMSWSEESRRYITMGPELQVPELRAKAENVKQGSTDQLVDGWEELINEVVMSQAHTINLYYTLLEKGVAPEVARVVLPQNLMVTWVWTGSLLGFYQMYAQRSFPTAQKEARDFVALVEEIIEPLYPVSWAALKEHQPWEEGKNG